MNQNKSMAETIRSEFFIKLGSWNRIKEETKDPMKYQEKYLLDILQKNKDTEYGKKYDFANIRSISDYQKKVPVAGYDHFEPYILRESDNCEKNLLCADETIYYFKTSGSVGIAKRVPVTANSLRGYLDSLRALFELISEKIGLEWTKGRSCLLVTPSTGIKTMNNGKLHAQLSTVICLRAKDTFPLSAVFTTPMEAFVPSDDTDLYYLHVLFALKDKDLTSIMSIFSGYLLRFFQYIENHWPMLLEDLENGTINPSVMINDSIRSNLSANAKLTPEPLRASELRAVFEQGFEKPIVKKIWPKIQYTICSCTSDFEQGYNKLRQRYTGDLPNLMVPYCMSEGSCANPIDINNGECVFVPSSLFFEFRPLDTDENDFSQIKLLDELEVGKDYEVILTNLAGLYRYHTKDAVHIIGMYQNTPTMVFLYRIERTINLVGEKTSESVLRTVMTEAEKHFGFELVGYSVYPDNNGETPRYIFYIEANHIPEGIQPKEIRDYIEKQLLLANPDDDLRSQLGPIQVNFLAHNSYIEYLKNYVQKIRSVSQAKPVTIIRSDIEKKFFDDMTEYSSEI